MEKHVLARILHELAAVNWFGSVAMITLVIRPQMRAPLADERIARIEDNFGGRAKHSASLAARSRLRMLWLK